MKEELDYKERRDNAYLRLECLKVAIQIVSAMNHSGHMTALTVEDNINRKALEISKEIGMKSN